MAASSKFIKPYNGNPQLGNLETPLNSSGLTKGFIGNLPAYRPGLSAQRRGLEIGMAHGYWLVGPFAILGPLRNEPIGLLAGFLSACGIVLLMTMALSIYSYVTDDDTFLGSKENWSNFAAGFLVGGFGGAITAYLLIENSDVISTLPSFLQDFQRIAG